MKFRGNTQDGLWNGIMGMNDFIKKMGGKK